MLTNLLTQALPEGYQEISVGLSALYALIGFIVVFVGITFLIFVVWGVGKVMDESKPKTATASVAKKEKVEKTKKSEPVYESIAVTDADEISDETVAVIMSALMAYYQKTNAKCEFTVKRIKRI